MYYRLREDLNLTIYCSDPLDNCWKVFDRWSAGTIVSGVADNGMLRVSLSNDYDENFTMISMDSLIRVPTKDDGLPDITNSEWEGMKG
jgi:hypothetical protein